MVVSVNPVVHRTAVSFGDDSETSGNVGIKQPTKFNQEDMEQSDVLVTHKPEKEDDNTTPKGIISKVAYAWVNLSETTKGIVKGLIYGTIAGSLFAASNMVYAGAKKISAKEIKFLEIFNPKKSMTKTGAVLSGVTAAAVFAGNLILARLRANERTADVDHMLYDGHRSK